MSNDTTSTKGTYFTTRGAVRGCCDHKHRTVETATKCLNADRKGCKAQGGYSDRTIERVSADGSAEWVAPADSDGWGYTLERFGF